MCEVLDFREKRGEARVITLLSKLLEEGKSEIIPLITSDASMREKYFEKYGI